MNVRKDAGLSPIYTPQPSTPSGVVNGIKEVLRYSDTHLAEIAYTSYIGLIKPIHCYMNYDQTVLIPLGIALWIFQIYAIGRQSISLREMAQTFAMSFTIILAYYEFCFKGSVGLHSTLAIVAMLFLKWRLMTERLYRELQRRQG